MFNALLLQGLVKEEELLLNELLDELLDKWFLALLWQELHWCCSLFRAWPI